MLGVAFVIYTVMETATFDNGFQTTQTNYHLVESKNNYCTESGIYNDNIDI